MTRWIISEATPSRCPTWMRTTATKAVSAYAYVNEAWRTKGESCMSSSMLTLARYVLRWKKYSTCHSKSTFRYLTAHIILQMIFIVLNFFTDSFSFTFVSVWITWSISWVKVNRNISFPSSFYSEINLISKTPLYAGRLIATSCCLFKASALISLLAWKPIR